LPAFLADAGWKPALLPTTEDRSALIEPHQRGPERTVLPGAQLRRSRGHRGTARALSGGCRRACHDQLGMLGRDIDERVVQLRSIAPTTPPAARTRQSADDIGLGDEVLAPTLEKQRCMPDSRPCAEGARISFCAERPSRRLVVRHRSVGLRPLASGMARVARASARGFIRCRRLDLAAFAGSAAVWSSSSSPPSWALPPT